MLIKDLCYELDRPRIYPFCKYITYQIWDKWHAQWQVASFGSVQHCIDPLVMFKSNSFQCWVFNDQIYSKTDRSEFKWKFANNQNWTFNISFFTFPELIKTCRYILIEKPGDRLYFKQLARELKLIMSVILGKFHKIFKDLAMFAFR